MEVIRRCGGDGSVCRLDADCAGETCERSCVCDEDDNLVCEVSGPVGERNCLASTNKRCWTNADCTTGEGACVALVGPPSPLVANGTPMCLVTYVDDEIRGTVDLDRGEWDVAVSLRSRVALGEQLGRPCPRCGTLEQQPAVGDEFRCEGSVRDDKLCTVDGVHPEFGGVSKDCPPYVSSAIGGQGLAIHLRKVTTGTGRVEATLPCGGSLSALHPSTGNGLCLDTFAPCASNADCMRCSGDPAMACADDEDCGANGECLAAPDQPMSCGINCHCGFCDGDPDAPCFGDGECGEDEACIQGSGVTQQLQNNACTSLTCGIGGPEQCCSETDANCADPTPLVGRCEDQPYRACVADGDCTNAGAAGPCVLTKRACFEDAIERRGEPSPFSSYCLDDAIVAPCVTNADCMQGTCIADSAAPTLVALFCVPPTQSASINHAAGIPGPAAVSLATKVRMYRCGDGNRGGAEECDDGNTWSGDGCNEICQWE